MHYGYLELLLSTANASPLIYKIMSQSHQRFFDEPCVAPEEGMNAHGSSTASTACCYQMDPNASAMAIRAPPFVIPAPRIRTTGSMQETLDSLYDDWTSVDIVFRSLQSAFVVRPRAFSDLSDEEYLDDIDRELSIAYDDLMAQVRRLYRNLNRLSREMTQYKAAVDSRHEGSCNGGLQKHQQ